MSDERRDKRPEDGQGGGRRRFGRRRPRPISRDQASGDAGTEKDASAQRVGGGQPSRGAQQGRQPGPRPPAQPRPESPVCPLCGKPIFDLSTALGADRESGAPAHFDCVAERIMAAESIGPNERLVYLGSGAFGVIEYKDKSESAFTVKRRIQWEKEGEKKDWRKNLSSRILKI